MRRVGWKGRGRGGVPAVDVVIGWKLSGRRARVLGLDAVARAARRSRGVALAAGDRGLGGAQGAREGERAAALVGREAHVAARQREPVGLAHGRQHGELDGQVEVAHHAAQDGDLLGVLLAEERDVGRTTLSSLVTTVQTPAKWPRAALGALQHVGQAARRGRSWRSPGG